MTKNYLAILFVILIIFIKRPVLANDDPRSFTHGIGIARDSNNGNWIFFSSSGLPPSGEDPNGNWTHDVYVVHWLFNYHTNPNIFIHKPEAQEPVAVAQTTDGHIMLTFEDGWNAKEEVSQRYGVYDADLKPILPYPQTVDEEGHSGHVAAVDNSFVVVYSRDWVEGGGVNNYGTGNGVYIKTYDYQGKQTGFKNVAVNRREWWPLVSASPQKAFILWQAYVKGKKYAQLKFAIFDPNTGQLTLPQILRDKVQYYNYALGYSTTAKVFLVVGTTFNHHGFAYTIDENAIIKAGIDCMPATVRESGIVMDKSNAAYIPSADDRLMRIQISDDTLVLTGVMPSPLLWSTVGNAGFSSGIANIQWFSLTRRGLEEANFKITDMVDPNPQDNCAD